MTDMVSNGLEAAALAMIFMPEPATTVLGIALLGYARKRRINNIRAAGRNRASTGIEANYYYKVQRVKGDLIGYQLSPIREGQLAKSLPKGVSQANQPGWQEYRNRPLQYRAKRISPSMEVGQLPKPIRKSNGLIEKPQEWQAYRRKTLQQAAKKTTMIPEGQLPSYKATGLIKKKDEWQAYRNNSATDAASKRKTQQFSGLQRGLLHKP